MRQVKLVSAFAAAAFALFQLTRIPADLDLGPANTEILIARCTVIVLATLAAVALFRSALRKPSQSIAGRSEGQSPERHRPFGETPVSLLIALVLVPVVSLVVLTAVLYASYSLYGTSPPAVPIFGLFLVVLQPIFSRQLGFHYGVRSTAPTTFGFVSALFVLFHVTAISLFAG